MDKTEVVKEEDVKKEEVSEEVPRKVLLGTISYVNDSDYEKFLNNLDLNQSVWVIMSAVEYAQTRKETPVYSMYECELIAKANRTIKSASEPTSKSDADNKTTEKSEA